MAMKVYGGGPNPPVRLDPFQNIIEVHWRDKTYIGPGFSVTSSHVHSSNVSCSGPYSGAFNGNLHSRNYLVRATSLVGSAPADGADAYLTPPGGGASVHCIASGFQQGKQINFTPWTYARHFTGSDIIRRLKPVGATIEMEIIDAHSLDADPVCRSLIVGGALSAARTGDITIAGPTLDFSAATMTEVGGEGRVFRVTSIDGGIQDGSGAWTFIFGVS